MNVSCSRIIVGLVLVGSLMAATPAQSAPVPIYWLNFDEGDGVPDITPGGGTLAITNSANATVAFQNSGGIFGGVLNATGQNQQVADPSGVASTTVTGGSAITNLPNQTGNGVGSMNQFTITFWVKHTGAGPTSGSVTPRILTLGDSATTDAGANAVQFHMRNTGNTGASDKTLSVPFERPSANNATNATDADFIGSQLANNTWYFIALTYDGTSSQADNSTVQNTATGGLSSMNGQYYKGTEELFDSLSRVAIAFTSDTTSPVPGDISNGAVEFGSAARLYLMNRISTIDRGLQGMIDDVRIYDSVLSADDVNTVRVQGLTGVVPEPASVVSMSLGMIGLAVFGALRRKAKKS